MKFSEILVKLSDDFKFAFLSNIGREITLKTQKGKKYAEAKIVIPLEIDDLRVLREDYVIFLGILPKDKFDKFQEADK